MSEIQEIGQGMVRAIKNGGKVIVFGNGGSSAEAAHFATELMSKCSKDHDPWAALSLSDSSSNLTAIGNDYGFDKIFSRQIEGLALKRDFVIGFSTSGKSINVINALKSANKIGCESYLFTGSQYIHSDSSKWKVLCVPSAKTTIIQEAHLWIIHVLSEFCEMQM